MPSKLQILHGQLCEAGFGVVMGEQRRLGFGDRRKLCLQYLGNALMVLLPRALEQRLIGRVLNEGMLEALRGLGEHALLIEQFRLHELA